jgi:osmotically-inducible protein OsmY
MKHFMAKSVLALGATSVMLLAQSSPPAASDPQSSQATPASDTQTAAKVRQAIEQDQTAGSAAHNVRVTAKNGMVTLRGKVTSEQEKDAVVSDAKKIAGDANVKDEITVSKSK